MTMKKNLYRILIFLCVYIPLENVLEEIFGIGAKLLPDILVVACFVAFSIGIRFRYRFRKEDFFLAAFLVAAFITTIFVNRVGIVNYIYEFRCLFLYYTIYIMVRDMHYGDAEISRIAAILKGILIVFFAFGIVEKIFNKEILYFESVSSKIIYADNFQRVYGLVFNPNTYAAFALLAFLIILYDAVKNGKSYIGMSVITVVTMYLTMSRSAAIIGLILLALILAAVIKNGKFDFAVFLKNAGMIAAGSLLICVLVVLSSTMYYKMTVPENEQGDTTSLFNRLEGSFSEKELDNSLQEGRIFSVVTGLKIFKEYPVLGTGLGTYGSAASMRHKPALYDEYGISEGFYADDQYITLLVETGLIGILLIGAFVLSILWGCRKSFWKILLLVFAAWMGVFYNIFEMRILMFFIWMLLGFEFGEAKKKEGMTGNEK